MATSMIGLDRKTGIRFNANQEFSFFGVNLTEDPIVIAGGVRILGVERPVHWDLQGPPRVEDDGRRLTVVYRPRVDLAATYQGDLPVPAEEGASFVVLVYSAGGAGDDDVTRMEIRYDLSSLADAEQPGQY